MSLRKRRADREEAEASSRRKTNIGVHQPERRQAVKERRRLWALRALLMVSLACLEYHSSSCRDSWRTVEFCQDVLVHPLPPLHSGVLFCSLVGFLANLFCPLLVFDYVLMFAHGRFTRMLETRHPVLDYIAMCQCPPTYYTSVALTHLVHIRTILLNKVCNTVFQGWLVMHWPLNIWFCISWKDCDLKLLRQN